MRTSRRVLLQARPPRLTGKKRTDQTPALIQLHDATFYRQQPNPHATPDETTRNLPLFPHLDLTIPAASSPPQRWAIIGPTHAGKTTLLEILHGQHLAFPPAARTYPYLDSAELRAKDARLGEPARAIRHVTFGARAKGLSGAGTYLSARYESRREATDFSLRDFLTGNTQLNAAEADDVDEAALQRVVGDLQLQELLGQPVTNLSHGQSRRARIAQALLGRPELLLLDEPFMGLDPPTTLHLYYLLQRLSAAAAPRLIISLRPQDPIPDWITHVAWLGETLRVTHQGRRDDVLRKVVMGLEEDMRRLRELTLSGGYEALDQIPPYYAEMGKLYTPRGVQRSKVVKIGPVNQKMVRHRFEQLKVPVGEPLVEMEGVQVRYGDRIALGGWEAQQHVEKQGGQLVVDTAATAEAAARAQGKPGLWWTVRRGERWAVCGANGSGKTTLLALLLSDHPQAYSAPMRLFGRPRTAQAGQPGLSVFDLQRRIGHSSPEVHAFFPKQLTVRGVLESAYADTPLGRPQLSVEADARVSACLRWFQRELNPALGMYGRHREDLLRLGQPHTRMVSLHGVTRPDLYAAATAAFAYDRELEQERSVAWADSTRFGELNFAGQRVALFLRAVVAQPDLVVLDEAFGGLDDLVRDKCLLFLEAGESRRMTPWRKLSSEPRPTLREDRLGAVDRGEHEVMRNTLAVPTGLTAQQALVVVSHVRDEIPCAVRDWMFLPAPGSRAPCRVGRADEPLAHDAALWDAVWGLRAARRRSSSPPTP